MDYGKEIKVILFPAIIFVVFVLLDYLLKLTLIVHEFGHFFACKLLGGKVLKFEVKEMGGKVKCYFGPNIQKYKLVFLSFAGILAELLFALIFLLIPYTSHIGGYLVHSIGWGWFLKCYATDFEIVPILLAFPIRLSVFVLCVVVYIISWLIAFRSWEKLIKK